MSIFNFKVNSENILEISVSIGDPKKYTVYVDPSMISIVDHATDELIDAFVPNDKITKAKIFWVQKKQNGFLTVKTKEVQIEGDKFYILPLSSQKNAVLIEQNDNMAETKKVIVGPKQETKKIPVTNHQSDKTTLFKKETHKANNTQKNIVQIGGLSKEVFENEFHDGNAVMRYISIVALCKNNPEKLYTSTFKEFGLLDKGVLKAYGPLFLTKRRTEYVADFIKYKRADHTYNKAYESLSFKHSKKGGRLTPFRGWYELSKEKNTLGICKVQMMMQKNPQLTMSELPSIAISISEFAPVNQRQVCTVFQNILNLPSVQQKFGGEVKYALLHDLKKDGVFFVSDFMDADAPTVYVKMLPGIEQAYPIETDKKHILGNIPMIPKSELYILFGKNSQSVKKGSKLACLNVLDKEQLHIGKIYLTR